MKKLLLALLAAALLAVPASSQIFIFHEVPPLPEVSFTAADIIRLMSSVNLKQQESPAFCESLHGLTSYHTNTIEICAHDAAFFKQEVLIHELLHLRYGEVGINTGGPYEDQIEEKAWAIYQQLFGVPAAQQQQAQSQETPQQTAPEAK